MSLVAQAFYPRGHPPKSHRPEDVASDLARGMDPDTSGQNGGPIEASWACSFGPFKSDFIRAQACHAVAQAWRKRHGRHVQACAASRILWLTWNRLNAAPSAIDALMGSTSPNFDLPMPCDGVPSLLLDTLDNLDNRPHAGCPSFTNGRYTVQAMAILKPWLRNISPKIAPWLDLEDEFGIPAIHRLAETVLCGFEDIRLGSIRASRDHAAFKRAMLDVLMKTPRKDRHRVAQASMARLGFLVAQASKSAPSPKIVNRIAVAFSHLVLGGQAAHRRAELFQPPAQDSCTLPNLWTATVAPILAGNTLVSMSAFRILRARKDDKGMRNVTDWVAHNGPIMLENIGLSPLPPPDWRIHPLPVASLPGLVKDWSDILSRDHSLYALLDLAEAKVLRAFPPLAAALDAQTLSARPTCPAPKARFRA